MMRARILLALMQFFYNHGIKKVEREALERVLAEKNAMRVRVRRSTRHGRVTSCLTRSTMTMKPNKRRRR
jgi:hypothetical protein